jgi:C4-type Zn-finger protein
MGVYVNMVTKKCVCGHSIDAHDAETSVGAFGGLIAKSGRCVNCACQRFVWKRPPKRRKKR